MPNNARLRGDYFERRTRETLEHDGWLVIRSAGSLGVADLVALKTGRQPMLISCKMHGHLPRRELNALEAAGRAAGAWPVLAWRIKGGWLGLAIVSRHGNRMLPEMHMPPARPERAKSDGLSPNGVQLTLPGMSRNETFE